VRLEIGNRAEIEGEFLRSEQDKQDREIHPQYPQNNNTPYEDGQARETEFAWSENDKHEKERVGSK
jgi:hypothetical protein